MPRLAEQPAAGSRVVPNDADGDGLHDPGETYVDANGNESYDQEAYDPLTTGYVPAVDLGLELVLHVGSSSTPNPGQYLAVALPPVNRGTPELTPDAYRIAWSDCQPTPVEPGDMVQVRPDLVTGPTNQAMRDLIGLDPDAYWDNGSVQGSAFPTSPRILFIPVYDPRIALTPSSNRLVVVKVVAFFMEQMTGPAQVRGRLLRVASSGETCGGAGAGGFIVECPVPAAQSSWGRIKSVYR